MTVDLPDTSRVARSQDHLSADIGEQIVLMSVHQGKYVGLDTIGAAIWRRLEQPLSVADLCGQLMEDFEADPAQLRRDVSVFLTYLHRHGLIEIDQA